jgi:hypothetical protein
MFFAAAIMRFYVPRVSGGDDPLNSLGPGRTAEDRDLAVNHLRWRKAPDDCVRRFPCAARLQLEERGFQGAPAEPVFAT